MVVRLGRADDKKRSLLSDNGHPVELCPPSEPFRRPLKAHNRQPPVHTLEELQLGTDPEPHQIGDFKAFIRGQSIDDIAHRRGICRNTVQDYLVECLLSQEFGALTRPLMESFKMEMEIDGWKDAAYDYAMENVRVVGC